MKNIVNKDKELKKELKIFLENRIFNIEEDYVLTSDKKKCMEVSKIIYLYLLIATKTGIASNKLDCNIALLLKWQGLSEHADSIKLTRERLNYLVEQNFISVDVDIMKAKKNDLIEIEILVSDCSYTMYTEREIEIFNKLEANRAVIFMYLLRYRHKMYGYAFTTLFTITAELKMSKVTVLDCIKELVARRIISIENPNFYRKNEFTGQIVKSNNRYYFNLDNIENINLDKDINLDEELNKIELEKANKNEENKEVIETDIKEDSINIKEEIIEIKEDSIIDKFKKFDVSRYSENKKDGLYTFDDINNKETIVTQQYNEIQFPENPF
ncbi:hypothetical protein [Clostridium sp.]|uniref:hypothetical protein n=1 Tax=Clostridium sp. TaxID=1506 RepID=UPI0039944E4A